MTGLVRFLAVEREIQSAGGRARLDLDALVRQAAAKPGLDLGGDIDADKIVDGRHRQIGELWRAEREVACKSIFQQVFVPGGGHGAEGNPAGDRAVAVYPKAKPGLAHIALQRPGRKGGETKLQKNPTDPAVSFEDAKINAAPVVGTVRRRLAAGRAVIDISVLEE